MVVGLSCLAAASVLASCALDSPTAPRDLAPSADVSGLDPNPPTASLFDGRVAVCHMHGPTGSIIRVSEHALAAHLAHGDYVAALLVSHETRPTNDGIHFRRISDALGAAREGRLDRGEIVSAACRISIVVSADTYHGTASGHGAGDIENFPLIVDVPDITMRGALAMGLDRDGRATGIGTHAGETTLTPVEPLPFVANVSTPIIIANAHPGGSAGNGLRVEGFVFQSGHDPLVDAGGQAVLSIRTTGLTIRGNRVEGGFTESIDIRSGSALVQWNHLSGTAGTCDICLAGPGRFTAIGNRLLAGGIPGISVSGVVNLPLPTVVEPLEIPATAETWADVRNNQVSSHLRTPVGTGLRVDAIGTGAPNVHNTIHAIFRDNLLDNNRFGVIVHAAFPKPNTALLADVDVTFSGNVIQHSCQAKLLVSFSRHTTALGLASAPYLLNSTFNLALHGNIDWSEVWYSHPAGFGNTLIVDGETIANGARQFYDATGCPGL
jgi:hypothetical protein